MAEIDKSVRRFKARQILIDMSVAEQPAFKIETDEGPVMVHTDRFGLEEFFRQAESIRISLLKTPDIFEEG